MNRHLRNINLIMFTDLYTYTMLIILFLSILISKNLNCISFMVYFEIIWINIFFLNIVQTLITGSLFFFNFVFILFFIACVEFILYFFILLFLKKY